MRGFFGRELRVALAVLLAVAAPALGQLQGGSITGSALDEQGAALPGVTITVQGLDATQTTTTDENGQFRFLNLAPGPYTVTAALQGFATSVRENVIVAVGRNVELPLALKLAAVQETVTVTGAVADRRCEGDRHGHELHVRRAHADSDITRSVRADALRARRPRRSREHRGQRDGSAVELRVEGHAAAGHGLDDGRGDITDMAATGASPTYFNYDNFEEIQVSTAGQSIKQPTGGIGMNMVVKRGTNQFRGSARGYFTSDGLEASNVPDELEAAGVTPETADHNEQISDYGYDIGGPIFRDRAWFYDSYSVQDVRLVRRAGDLIDRTVLKNPNVKLNWQATKADMINFLYFDGIKVKDGRSPGITGIVFDAPTATFHQDGAYADNPFHGLWKIGDDRVMAGSMFLSAKYAYYNTGFVLDPMGGMSQQAGRSFLLAQSFGSVNQSLNVRPQHTANVDMTQFVNAFGGTHDSRSAAVSERWRPRPARSGPATGFSRSRTRRPTSARRCSVKGSAATGRTTSTSTSATRSRRTG